MLANQDLIRETNGHPYDQLAQDSRRAVLRAQHYQQIAQETADQTALAVAQQSSRLRVGADRGNGRRRSHHHHRRQN